MQVAGDVRRRVRDRRSVSRPDPGRRCRGPPPPRSRCQRSSTPAGCTAAPCGQFYEDMGEFFHALEVLRRSAHRRGLARGRQSRSRCSSRSSSCGRSPGATSSRPRTRTPRSAVDRARRVPRRRRRELDRPRARRRPREDLPRPPACRRTDVYDAGLEPCHGDAARPGARAARSSSGHRPRAAPEPGRPAEPAHLRLGRGSLASNEGRATAVVRAAGNRCDRARAVGLTARRALQAARSVAASGSCATASATRARSRAGSCSSWVFRIGSLDFFLKAFHVHASIHNALLAQVVDSLVDAAAASRPAASRARSRACSSTS